jgi:GNAT superfamily N-acetyltransferase
MFAGVPPANCSLAIVIQPQNTMPVQPIFHLAQEANCKEILHMMEDFYSIDMYPFNRGDAENNLRLFLIAEHLGRIWIIEDKAQIIGYAILTYCFSFEFKGKTAFIDELFIREAYRGKGIGGQVIDFLIQQAPLLNLRALHLEVERHNERGNRLYLKKGFMGHKRFLMTRFID